VQSHEEWRERDAWQRSVPGIGVVTSGLLIALLPELGTLNRQKIAALVGGAPFHRDSGQFQGERRIWGGRAPVRAALYMATLSAVRFNPAIRTFYQRLLEQDKRKKAALIASMRKLLLLLNAVVKQRQPWSPDPLTA
jgi:transposase